MVSYNLSNFHPSKLFNKKFRFSSFVSVFILSVTSGIHSGMTKFAFTLWLKSCGVDIIHLALFSLTFLPDSLKMLWLPFLESLRLETFLKKVLKRKKRVMGHRKIWLLLLEVIIIFFTFSFCFIHPKQYHIHHLILYVGFYCAFLATKEAMSIAYNMEIIKAENWGRLEGKINAGFQTGFWLGGIFLFSLSYYFPWSQLFLGVTIVLIISLILTFFIQDSVTHQKTNQAKSLKQVFVEPYKDLIFRNKHILFSLFAFMVLYRMQDRLLMSVTNYFFVDLGFANQFLFGKTIGIAATIFGGLLGSFCVKKYGYKKALIIGIFGHGAASLLFLLQSIYLPKSYSLFYIIMFCEKFTRGFEATIFFTYQMIFCSKYFIVAQYSILIALEKLSGTIVSSLSGYIIAWYGWNIFFIFSFFGTIPSLWFLKKLPDSIDEVKK